MLELQSKRRQRDALDESSRIDLPRYHGAKAAIVGRAGYPAVVVWTREGNFVTRVVPRDDRGGWTVQRIAATLMALLVELQMQVETVAYEVAWRDAHASMQRLLRMCERAAAGWSDLHPTVVAREVKLYVHAPWSDDTQISGPTLGWRTAQMRNRDGYHDPVDGLDHLLIFAGETAGRIALWVERKEREREAAEHRDLFEDEVAHTGTIR